MRNNRTKASATVRDTAVFAMLGALMFASKLAFEALPNIHILGMLIIVYTLVYRARALIPIYIFVLLTGVYAGFSYWWVPYVYVWTVLWGVTMLLPKRMPRVIGAIVYPLLCALHGLAYGVLYAPMQALMFGLNFEQMLIWIATGFPFDVIHAVGNFVSGLLIIPLSELLCKLERGFLR
jgi:energy-coupling factor transport system substrate-specific component